jgi:hypothetical protein
MNRSDVTCLAVGVVFACAGLAMGQESVTYTGVESHARQGDPTNVIQTANLAGGYPVARVRVSGSLTEIRTSTFASDADIRVTASNGQIFTLNPFSTGGFTGTVTVSNYEFVVTPAIANAAGAWTLEFLEAFNDGAGADSVWDTITIEFVPPPPPPANDNCVNAISIAVGDSLPGTTLNATNSAVGSCGQQSANSPDVWYSFTAPYAGQFRIDTCDAVGYDTLLSMYTSCGSAELTCNDDSICSFGGSRSSIVATYASGETVLVRVSGFREASGAFVLNASAITPPPPPPANDACVNAAPLTDGAAQVYNSTSATDEGLTLTDCPITMYNDIFYTYTATCTGDATISTCGTSFDTILAVFGECGAPQVTCNDDTAACGGAGVQSSVTFPVVSGSTYTVAVGSFRSADEGPGLLNVSCAPAPCPADFNGDGFLDFFDYDDYVACFEGSGAPGCDADFNNDGFTDFFDYDDFVLAYEAGC